MRIIVVLFFLCAFTQVGAQTYEIGVFAGGANNIGDVGRASYILPSGPAFGGIFKWNKSKRYSLRVGITYGEFTADDSKSNVAARQQRGYIVDNSIFETSAGIEFNFVEFNLHQLGPAFTPYIYTGFTYFRYGYHYIDAGQVQLLTQKDGAFAIPMVVGFKKRLNQFLILGGEIGARYTFTDNLDASNPDGSNFENSRFGNINSDDWYVFSGLTLTYTFGRKPCLDCFQ